MTKYVTRTSALAGVRRAVQERGSAHVERRQFYFLDNGWPCCLVGHVFCYQGINHTDLELTAGPGSNFFPIHEIAGVTRPHVRAALFIQPDAVPLLEDAQHYQDEGLTWGEILTHLERSWS